MAANTAAMSQPNDEKRGGIMAWPAKVRDYFGDLKAEMKRVTWPNRKQVRATTAVVIAAVFMFAAYFAAVDLVLGRAINEIFQSLARR
jgi:preprotein translocase subunit SecE